jgi:hypothetical protein
MSKVKSQGPRKRAYSFECDIISTQSTRPVTAKLKAKPGHREPFPMWLVTAKLKAKTEAIPVHIKPIKALTQSFAERPFEGRTAGLRRGIL